MRFDLTGLHNDSIISDYLKMKTIFKAILLVALPLANACAQTNINKLPAWAFGGFVRVEHINPIISPDTNAVFTDPVSHKQVKWEANDTFNPAATLKNGKMVVLYRAEDLYGTGIGFRTSRVGYAESADGIHYKRRPGPVLYPANDIAKKYEWPGGCEDPRVAVTATGKYVVFYTEWNRDVPRLGVATSLDLIHWKKYGPMFRKAYKGKVPGYGH